MEKITKLKERNTIETQKSNCLKHLKSSKWLHDPVILKKVRISAEISGDVAERIKNAVYWTPGMTMAGFIEESLAEAIEKFEEEKGERFPQRERRLVGGRPMI